jgi:quercetin dioxygenase-like cupin family protein
LERRIDLGPGEMTALDSGIEHSLEATEESAFLLTISNPA